MDDDSLKKEHPELYKVAREGATEPPFVGKYVHTNTVGIYHCAICGAALLASDTKFDSNSGWPSFTDPAVHDAVTLHADEAEGILRTEVRCAQCGAHLGHVFLDGPIKNGNVCDRYCINSISLDLKDSYSE